MDATKTRTGYILTIDGQTLVATKHPLRRNAGERYDITRDGEDIGNIICRPNGASWWAYKPHALTVALPGSFEHAVRQLMA